MAGTAGRQPAAVIAFVEMWNYQQARRVDKRPDWRIGAAVIQEPDGRRWVDFEVGDRSETPFLWLYARLPEAEQYRSDAYAAYVSWLPPSKHVVRKGGAVNRNEGLHSWLRSKLNRLARDTKGYTKSAPMLVYSLALMVENWTAQFNANLC